MHVIATAGHVDHGKSRVVRALTGMEPDRWAEERRRGMTIDLGFAWFRTPAGAEVALVDVPGHERFTTNMLAGIGAVPAVLLVVAADEGWGQQTEEHVRALDALGVRHALLVMTKCDLADPAPVAADARRRLERTSLGGVPWVAVSAETGVGLDELVDGIDAMVASLPVPDPRARVRLWVDRAFTIRGAGTVVTATLGAGTIAAGDVLELRGKPVAVRGLQTLGRPAKSASATARVALNLRGVTAGDVRRGDALTSPGRWHHTQQMDVWAGLPVAGRLLVHIGSAAVPAVGRTLGHRPDGTVTLRLLLASPLPLQVGDRFLLRDLARGRIVAGCTVLDPAPPAQLRGRAAARRAAELADEQGAADAGRELARRGAVRSSLLAAIGVDPNSAPGTAVAAGDWLVDGRLWQRWLEQLPHIVAASDAGAILASGLSAAEAVRSLHLPDPRLLEPLVAACPSVEQRGGRLCSTGTSPRLRGDVADAVQRLKTLLAGQPFAAPEQPQLAELGLTRRTLPAAAAAGALLLLGGEVALLPDAPQRAAHLLSPLAQPFTLSEARQALGTTRRVAVPLLEHMDALHLTERLGDGTRRVLTTNGAVARSAGAE